MRLLVWIEYNSRRIDGKRFTREPTVRPATMEGTEPDLT